MRRNITWAMSTISALVLLFSYHTSTDKDPARAPSAALASPTADTSLATAGATSSGATDSSTAGATAADQTVTGAAIATQWGPVQVQITVRDGKITAAEAVRYPSENPRDQQINAYAIPLLNEAAVKAQSADLDSISGATVTSQGYVQSLQSAIDQAHR